MSGDETNNKNENEEINQEEDEVKEQSENNDRKQNENSSKQSEKDIQQQNKKNLTKQSGNDTKKQGEKDLIERKAYMNKVSIYAGVVMVLSILILIVATNVFSPSIPSKIVSAETTGPTTEPTAEPTTEPTAVPSISTTALPGNVSSSLPSSSPQPTPTQNTTVAAQNTTATPVHRMPTPKPTTLAAKPPIQPPHISPSGPTYTSLPELDDFSMNARKSGGEYRINISVPNNGKNCTFQFYCRENNQSEKDRIYPSNTGGGTYIWKPANNDVGYDIFVDVYDGSRRLGQLRG